MGVNQRLGEWRLSAEVAGVRGAQAFVTVDPEGTALRPLYADLHVHSDDTVGTNDTLYNLSYGRDVAGLDILGYTANDFNITEQRWDQAVKLIQVRVPGGASRGCNGDHRHAEADATLEYRLLGEAGWEQVDLFDGDRLVWSRNLHEELGLSEQRIRVRLGGARIKDRYRGAYWTGEIRVSDTFSSAPGKSTTCG